MTMKMKQVLIRTSVFLLAWAALSQPLLLLPAVGQEEEQQRDIEAKEVLKGRRRGGNPHPNRRYVYKVKLPADRADRVGDSKSRQKGALSGIGNRQKFPTDPPARDMSYMTLGVTLWRVRLATEADRKDPKIAKERMTWDREDHAVVVARISDEGPVPNQDLLQMSIEYLPDPNGTGPGGSNKAAYLYVINREQFPDGSFKNARLIFPTLLTYAGDNRLLPGKTVTLPDPTRPFRITRDAAAQTQAFETYTIILSPSPLEGELPREVSRRAMELPPDLVTRWEQQIGITEVRADLRGGVGQVRSQRELLASGDAGESRGTEDSAEDLTQDDLPPQTVFRKAAKPGAGMLVRIRVPFKEVSTKP